MWEKEIWIARRLKIETNDEGIDISYFEKPIKYRLNYQPVSGYLGLVEYGENVKNVYRAYINRSLQGLLRVGDRVYLSDNEILESELEDIAMSDDEFCKNANYEVTVALPQNLKIKVDFTKRRKYGD